ncbi:siderophore-interacting protein [Kitasatospora herbaricolor]|uniref:siderophore-interacting protein n=1 Tax=Kitasatospora herbaricolor TaxID=68217 RepID=UPI00174A33FA|nr:siderophore-interacting protein [Kitasatospora herbaricolor]MDQ0309203.1 NADPH-dependent ferric siderophore reductase [Kitasatospora herbaricolor]GGV03618.1 siderophore-interacting protein [Kitasatospora herbaricolor]
MSGGSENLAAQYDFFEAQVVRTERLGPTMLRITFGGGQLARFVSGGRDQSFSLFLPHPGQAAPVLPVEEGEGWFAAWRALPEDVRAVMRSYTVRAQRRDPDEVDVDFALHGVAPSWSTRSAGPAGPAATWAAAARTGDRVILLGPAVQDNRSVCFRPPAGTDWVLIAADETALPAAGGILDQLPPGLRARVWIEVPHAEDIQDLDVSPETDITWLVRDTPAAPSPLIEAVRAADLPDGTPYAWIAGESGTVKALRRHLVAERGLARRTVTFAGYWRRGASEEDLRTEALTGAGTDGG